MLNPSAYYYNLGYEIILGVVAVQVLNTTTLHITRTTTRTSRTCRQKDHIYTEDNIFLFFIKKLLLVGRMVKHYDKQRRATTSIYIYILYNTKIVKIK